MLRLGDGEISIALWLARALAPVAEQVRIGARVGKDDAVDPVAQNGRERDQRDLVEHHRQLGRGQAEPAGLF